MCLYGAGPATVAEQAGITEGEAKEAIKDYFSKFPKLKRWLDSVALEIETKGYIYSFFGRKRRLLNAKSTDKALKAHDIRSGTNALIQSVASDCNLTGAMNAYDRLKANKVDFNMFALVHDSVVSEVREDMVEDYIRILKEELLRDYGLSIPGCPIGVDFGVGDTYAEAG